MLLEILEERGEVWPLLGGTRWHRHSVTPPFSMHSHY
jgi:hypothetical protein